MFVTLFLTMETAELSFIKGVNFPVSFCSSSHLSCSFPPHTPPRTLPLRRCFPAGSVFQAPQPSASFLPVPAPAPHLLTASSSHHSLHLLLSSTLPFEVMPPVQSQISSLPFSSLPSSSSSNFWICWKQEQKLGSLQGTARTSLLSYNSGYFGLDEPKLARKKQITQLPRQVLLFSLPYTMVQKRRRFSKNLPQRHLCSNRSSYTCSWRLLYISAWGFPTPHYIISVWDEGKLNYE